MSTSLLYHAFSVRSYEHLRTEYRQGAIYEHILEPLVSLLDSLNERIAGLDKELAQRAKSDEQAVRLQQIPGVGPIISLMFLAVLDGASRFTDAHQVMSYLGLVPREKSSGEKQMRGHRCRSTRTSHRPGCCMTSAFSTNQNQWGKVLGRQPVATSGGKWRQVAAGGGRRRARAGTRHTLKA